MFNYIHFIDNIFSIYLVFRRTLSSVDCVCVGSLAIVNIGNSVFLIFADLPIVGVQNSVLLICKSAILLTIGSVGYGGVSVGVLLISYALILLFEELAVL